MRTFWTLINITVFLVSGYYFYREGYIQGQKDICEELLEVKRKAEGVRNEQVRRHRTD